MSSRDSLGEHEVVKSDGELGSLEVAEGEHHLEHGVGVEHAVARLLRVRLTERRERNFDVLVVVDGALDPVLSPELVVGAAAVEGAVPVGVLLEVHLQRQRKVAFLDRRLTE